LRSWGYAYARRSARQNWRLLLQYSSLTS
jgi:hypothetical protein